MRENEFVYVYFGRLASQLRPDPAEIADVALLSWHEICRRIGQRTGRFNLAEALFP